jgi:hypothetical protein
VCREKFFGNVEGEKRRLVISLRVGKNSYGQEHAMAEKQSFYGTRKEKNRHIGVIKGTTAGNQSSAPFRSHFSHNEYPN